MLFSCLPQGKPNGFDFTLKQDLGFTFLKLQFTFPNKIFNSGSLCHMPQRVRTRQKEVTEVRVILSCDDGHLCMTTAAVLMSWHRIRCPEAVKEEENKCKYILFIFNSTMKYYIATLSSITVTHES